MVKFFSTYRISASEKLQVSRVVDECLKKKSSVVETKKMEGGKKNSGEHTEFLPEKLLVSRIVDVCMRAR